MHGKHVMKTIFVLMAGENRMKCIECDCCRKGWFKSKPNDYVCIGVPEPFVIEDINVECTEYEDRRNKKVGIKEAIAHFK